MAKDQRALDAWLEEQRDPWIDDFNDLIRNVLFGDEVLKSLMKVPDRTGVIEFIDRFFIRAGYTNKTLTNESVRIVYGIVGLPTDNPNVTRNQISFDIYVKNEDLHNVSKDRLMMRTQLIARRLIYLLTEKRYNGVYRFHSPSEGDMGTSAIGYARYNVSLSFMKTY